MKSGLIDTRNSFDYFLRSRLKLSRRSYREKGIHLHEMLQELGPDYQKIVRRLIWRYDLEKYLGRLRHRSFFDNIMHLLLLDELKPYLPLRQAPKKILDIGSKNFSYVISLFEFSKAWAAEKKLGFCSPEITGIEVDPYRIYRDLYTRLECANFYCSLIPNASYIDGDVVHDTSLKSYDLICHFFPFIQKNSLLDYGLPLRFFQPLAIFRRSHQLLNHQGLFIMANITQDEYLQGKALLEISQFIFIKKKVVEMGPFTPTPLIISVFLKP